MDGPISLLDFGSMPQDAHALISDRLCFHKMSDSKRVDEKFCISENSRISENVGFQARPRNVVMDLDVF